VANGGRLAAQDELAHFCRERKSIEFEPDSVSFVFNAVGGLNVRSQ
jgi:hypothetical protein